MMMFARSSALLLAIVACGLVPGTAHAQKKVTSSVTIAKVDVVKHVGTQYKVTVTGSKSLAKTDTYTSYAFILEAPDDDIGYTANITFTPPTPGTSSDFTVVYYVEPIAGDWTTTAKLNFTSGGTPGTAATTSPAFTVP